MFPTKGKDKIPRSLAYPASAKLISESLAGVPQAEELYITFASYWASASRKSAKPYKVMSAEYSYYKASQFTPHYFEEAGANNPKWAIQVEAVPSAIKNHITELLQHEAFPKMYTWLLTKKDITGTERSQRFEVIYNEQMDKLEYKDNPHW